MNLDLKLKDVERIIDCLPAGIMAFDPEMRLRLWNDQALALTGIGIEDMLSDDYSVLLKENVRRMLAETSEQAGSSRRHLLNEEDGRTVSFTSTHIPDDKRGFTVLIAEDATYFQAADGIKRDFIGSLLHKLRGPLSTLKTSLSMLQDGAAEGISPQGREILDMGYHEVNRLVTLLGDLRDLFLIETGLVEKEMEIEVFPLSSALDRAVEEIGKMAPPFDTVRGRLMSKGSFNILVKTDFEKLKKVFSILLKNALMYSPELYEVSVECASDNDSVDIRVRDRGIGVSEKSMPLLFSKYFRETNDVTRAHEGNGLGLFMAKSFIELMKGTIYCESVQGKGSIFFISLPAAGVNNHG